jgi:hypothetical protein
MLKLVTRSLQDAADFYPSTSILATEWSCTGWKLSPPNRNSDALQYMALPEICELSSPSKNFTEVSEAPALVGYVALAKIYGQLWLFAAVVHALALLVWFLPLRST